MTVSPSTPCPHQVPHKVPPSRWRYVALDLAVKTTAIGIVEWVKHAIDKGWLQLP